MFLNTVLFKVYGDETGKFLSLCKKNNVNIRNFNKNTKETFGLVSAKEYKKASNFAKKSGIRLKIIKKFGIEILLTCRCSADNSSCISAKTKFNRVFLSLIA